MKFSNYVSLKESKSENIAPATLKVRLIDRFNKDSNVTLDELKDIAKDESTTYEKVVETLCDILQGSLYRRKEIREKNINFKELEMGMKHEMEHTKDKNIAEIIARDHLTHVPNYYTLLKDIDDD